jgi:hypothetical protein
MIRSRLERAIGRTRDIARGTGSTRLGFELSSMKRETPARWRRPHEVIQDLRRSRKAAEVYAKTWLNAAEIGTARGASSATDYALERAALTEASHAFNDARLAEARDLPAEVVADLKREWDAEAGACIVCAAADGTIVGIHENFPLGEPGDVHPNCACTWTLVGH